VFIFIIAYGVDPTWTWLLLPVIIAPLAILTGAVAMLLSALYVKFRDVLIIWTVFASMLFYATPILYPVEIESTEGFRAVLMANPIAVILEQARVWIIDPTAPSPADAAGGAVRLLIPLAIFIGTCILGWRVFTRQAPKIAEAL
jgi:ABC-2 type transport system permease protein